MYHLEDVRVFDDPRQGMHVYGAWVRSLQEDNPLLYQHICEQVQGIPRDEWDGMDEAIAAIGREKGETGRGFAAKVRA